MPRRFFLPWLFSLLLLLAQQGLLLHGLQHREAAPGGPVCEQCVAFATVSGAAPAADAPAVAAFDATPTYFPFYTENFLPIPARPFLARGPPLIS